MVISVPTGPDSGKTVTEGLGAASATARKPITSMLAASRRAGHASCDLSFPSIQCTEVRGEKMVGAIVLPPLPADRHSYDGPDHEESDHRTVCPPRDYLHELLHGFLDGAGQCFLDGIGDRPLHGSLYDLGWGGQNRLDRASIGWVG